ncbi:MAG: 23S rRNA (uracil(1939)-C(5))-methyltransferase RlmD [Chitinophagaceae bacterium]
MRKKKPQVILKDILVTDYAAEGKSIAKVDGKVIFIEKAVPGDIVDVKLMKSKKDWAEGFPLAYKEYSKDRVQPFCQHFGICGGCIWQMLPYSKQLQYKHQQVIDNLQRIAKVELPEIATIAGADETEYYRNKLEYTFSTKRYVTNEDLAELRKNGERYEDVAAAGFHARGFFDKVVELETCHLQKEPTNKIRNTVAAYAKENNLTFYDIRNHIGFLRNMMVRFATTGELMVNVVVGENNPKAIEALMQFMLQQFPEITTLLYTINLKFNDSIFDLEPIVYKGKGYIVEKLEDYQFKISPKSFFQTNTKQAEKLYKITRDFAELDGTQIVYDLYGGTGSIGIFVSNKAKKIVGVELIKEAVDDAKENAAMNHLSNADFFVGDVIDICTDDFFNQNGKPDVIITDPPRAGMHEKLVKKLLDMAAPTIVYVSCNPATQARDLAMLDEKYKVTKVQPVDMFPHTHHIENVVQLKLKELMNEK